MADDQQTTPTCKGDIRLGTGCGACARCREQIALGHKPPDRRDAQQATPAPMSLAVFARLVANLYRHEPDECVITLGDWQPSPVGGDRLPLFHGTLRVTVGDFRRWAPDHVRGGPI